MQLNQADYAALQALYTATNGDSWSQRAGWQDWDFSRQTPPDAAVVNGWHGVSTQGDRVTFIDLNNNQLSGTLPSELGNLSELTALYLYNNQLTGSVPTTLGNLTKLNHLALSSNQLEGDIPSELGNLSDLQFLYLNNNQLTGSLPSSLGNLNELLFLSAASNQLSGTIPSELSNLSKLNTLQLSDNQLSGTIPTAVETWLSSNSINVNFNNPIALTGLPATIDLLTMQVQLNMSFRSVTWINSPMMRSRALRLRRMTPASLPTFR